MAEVERNWFRPVLAGERNATTPALVASAPTLETRGFQRGEWFSLRWVLNHTSTRQ